MGKQTTSVFEVTLTADEDELAKLSPLTRTNRQMLWAFLHDALMNRSDSAAEDPGVLITWDIA